MNTPSGPTLNSSSSENGFSGKYEEISSYGLIGNMITSAHVSQQGSIDWFCYPFFDSPSVFGRMLDYKKGGHFKIAAKNARSVQQYWPDTNVLITRFFSSKGVAQLIDFMPVGNFERVSTERAYNKCSFKVAEKDGGSNLALFSNASKLYDAVHQKKKCLDSADYNWIVRRVEVVHGCMDFSVQCVPAFNYGRTKHSTRDLKNGKRIVFSTEDLQMVLDSSVNLIEEDSASGGAAVRFSLAEGKVATFIFRKYEEQDEDLHSSLSTVFVDELFATTINYWHKWLSQCTYQGRWREQIHRSALALKLMTFCVTGAIVASPTTSLPESIGGPRNWDYRFTWVRDASFVVYALIRIGFTREADQFMDFLEKRCKESIDLKNDEPLKESPLKTMYSIHGGPVFEEEILEHFEGYKGSKPVRIGNAAKDQLQLDIYGELLDAVYLYNKYSKPVSYDFWLYLRKMIDFVCDNWDQPDESIWEVRGEKRKFTYSQVMCWVCVDRGIRLADRRSLPCNRDKWFKTRDKIYEYIMEHGYSKTLNAFEQYEGSNRLDASALLYPLVFFVSASDPLMINTLEAIRKSPKQKGLTSGSLVSRYDATTDDGFSEYEEGTFNMCSFWLIEANVRTRQFKRVVESQLMFEQFMTFASPLGLYAEEMSFEGGHLGNYPQAFTHLALISSGYNVNRALSEGKFLE